ncbi:MAG: hypothetical protein LBE55_04595, partial [Clostridiales bacterium]|nr:hypothetical protein [Clostridiales bacterium]
PVTAHLTCHPERSEGSLAAGFFASLRMTSYKNDITAATPTPVRLGRCALPHVITHRILSPRRDPFTAHLTCHPERSEGSLAAGFFASLRMTSY